MSVGKQRIADFLFRFQILGALLFCGAYTYRSLYDVTGTSLAQQGLVFTYLFFHLALALGANRVEPSRGTRQAITTYATWIVLTAVLILVVATNPSYAWNMKDTTTLGMAGALTVAVIIIGTYRGLTLADPMMKAMFAIAYKAVPQVLLAWKFLAEGSSGTPWVAVVVGHVTILTRLGQIYFLVKEFGLDRNRKCLAVSETANELSWVIATIAWLIA